MSNVINREELMEMFDGDTELLTDLVDTYLKEKQDVLAQLRQAVQNKDAANIKAAAHNLKGSALTFCAPDVIAQGQELEQMGMENNLEGVEELFARFEAGLEQMEQELKAIVGRA